MSIVFVGIDLAKNVFAVHGVDEAGKPALVRPAVPRAKLHELIASLPPCTVAMEACTGAHHRARLFAALGHRRGHDRQRPRVPLWPQADQEESTEHDIVHRVMHRALMSQAWTCAGCACLAQGGSVGCPRPTNEAPRARLSSRSAA